MIIIYDKVNKKVINNMGTHSAYPDGNIPNLPTLPNGQIYIRLHDKSEDAKNIMLAKEYNIKFETKTIYETEYYTEPTDTEPTDEDIDFIQEIKTREVEKIIEIPVIEIIKTKFQARQEYEASNTFVKQQLQSQLDELDKKSVRDAEDILDVLITKGVLTLDDVPFVKQRKTQKQQLRQQLKNLEVPD